MKVYQEIKESREVKEVPKVNPFGSAKPRDERLYIVTFFSFNILHPFLIIISENPNGVLKGKEINSSKLQEESKKEEPAKSNDLPMAVDTSKSSNFTESGNTKPVETLPKKEEKTVEIKETKPEEKLVKGNEKPADIKTTKPEEKTEDKPKSAYTRVTETKEIAIQTMDQEAFLNQTPKKTTSEVIQKPSEVPVKREKTQVETTHSNQSNNMTQKENNHAVSAAPKQDKETNSKTETGTQKTEVKEKVQERQSEQKEKDTEKEKSQTQQELPTWGNDETVNSSTVKTVFS